MEDKQDLKYKIKVRFDQICMKFKEIDIHLVRYVSINFSSLKNLQRILTSPSLNRYIKNFKSQFKKKNIQL